MPRKLRVEYPGAIYHVMSRGDGKGERIIGEELKALKWRERDLRQRPKSDAAKLNLAARVRRETTLTIRQIAERLHLGSWKSLNNKLYLRSRGKGKPNKV